MSTLHAFIFANESAGAEKLAEVWNQLHGTWLTAEQVEAIANEANEKMHTASF